MHLSVPQRCRGLTLFELIVVMTILVALASLAIPMLSEQSQGAPEQATRATLAQVARVIIGPDGYLETMRYARDSDDTPYGLSTGLPWPGNDEITAGDEITTVRQNHPQLHYLFRAPVFDGNNNLLLDYDPASKIGWRGEWLALTTATQYKVVEDDGFTNIYGENNDLAPLDGWGNPIVIQWPEDPDSDDPADDNERFNVRLVSAGDNGVLDTPANQLVPSCDDKNDDILLYLFREDPNAC